jgi:hypothetical protein
LQKSFGLNLPFFPLAELGPVTSRANRAAPTPLPTTAKKWLNMQPMQPALMQSLPICAEATESPSLVADRKALEPVFGALEVKSARLKLRIIYIIQLACAV